MDKTTTRTDNEWAAEFLEMEMIGTVCWELPHTEGLPQRFHVSDWKPDTDLNQFKLVLERFIEWSKEQEYQDYGWHRELVAIQMSAWFIPKGSLNAIREAVENG